MSCVSDVHDVKFVINFDYPNNSEDYVHRIGRTGRANSNGTSYTLFTPSNGGKVRSGPGYYTGAGREFWGTTLLTHRPLHLSCPLCQGGIWCRVLYGGSFLGTTFFALTTYLYTCSASCAEVCVCGGGGGRGTVLCHPGEGCGKSDGNWMMVVGGGGGGGGRGLG